MWVSIILNKFHLILKSFSVQNISDPQFWMYTDIIRDKKYTTIELNRVLIESIIDIEIFFIHTLDTFKFLDLLFNFCDNIWQFDFLYLYSLINIFGAWTFFDIMWCEAWQQVIGDPVKLVSSHIRFTIHGQYKLSRIFQNGVVKGCDGFFYNYHNKTMEPGYFNNFKKYPYEGRFIKPPRLCVDIMTGVYIGNIRDGWLMPYKYQVYHLYAFEKISDCYLKVLLRPIALLLLWFLITFVLLFLSLFYFVFKFVFIKINKKTETTETVDKDNSSDKKNE